MKTLILILLTFSLSAQFDKTDLYHVYGSALITGVSAEIINRKIDKPWLSTFAGAGIAALAGAGKEFVWDGYMKLGTKSNSDLVNDARGIFLGMFVIRVKFDINYKTRKQYERENDY